MFCPREITPLTPNPSPYPTGMPVTFNIKHLTDMVRMMEPKQEWPLFYPKHYHTPEGYVPAKGASAFTMSAALHAPQLLAMVDSEGMQATSQELFVVGMTSALLSLHDMQNFWLGRGIGEALLHTEVPRDFILKDAPLPFPAFTIFLPKGLFITPTSGDVAFIQVARVERNERLSQDSLFISALSLPDYDRPPISWYGNYPLSGSIEKTMDTHYFAGAEAHQDGLLDAPDDKALPGRILALVANICFLMAERKNLVESDTVGGKHKASGGKKEFWLPRWVGRQYIYNRPDRGGSHASPRVHWRRGHWRGQRIGEGRTEIKRVWIEPLMVNVKEAT